MSKKLTYEFVKEYFEQQGCELLEEEYVRAHAKMKYQCSCGNISEIKYNDFQQGKRCAKCGGREKLTHKYVKQYFEDNGCGLLETEYINNHTNMEYICSCGNSAEITFNRFQYGHRCMKCGSKRAGEKQKHTFEYTNQYFEDNGCELLEKDYVDNHTKMKYKCSCGNISEITFGSFKHGHRCGECGGNEKLTYEYVESYFKDHVCILLEDEYVNANTKMKYICSCGNTSEITFSHFQQGQRCNNCGNEKRSEKLKHSFEYVKQYFSDRDCILLEDEYTNIVTKMKYKCSCGNISEVTFGSFNQGHRCMKCGYEKVAEKISGANHYNWNPDRNAVRNIRDIHQLSATYKNNYRKKYNITLKNIHIDHIIPVKAFVENGIFDLDIINDERNLRPLPGRENMSKNGYYDEDDFMEYIEQFIVFD